ncbi:DUF4982 domain-containing protein [Verrucomicrobia bacterium S94]|nr:DUF4982 domain-containing protein [Verrucomicrobia bacterium S94]
MKNIQIALLLGLTAVTGFGLPEGYPETPRVKTKINQHWKFHLGDPDAEFFKSDTNDQSWETVHVPHTLELTSMSLNDCQDDKYQETFMREVGWYRRDIRIFPTPGKRIFLEFEGAHQVTDCWVNGKHAGRFAVGGYSPFHFDITDDVEPGKTAQITLRVDNRKNETTPPDPGPFDYIKFGGLYRDVYLVEKDPLHITFNWEAMDAGVKITTPTVDPVNLYGSVNVKTTVRNTYDVPRETTLITRVIDADGLVVLKLEDSQIVEPQTDFTFNQIGSIEENLQLWGIDHPYLYRVNSLVLDEDKPVDCVENRMGFRKVEITDRGVVLNGEPIKLMGMNRHQHYGYIGDALPDSLHYKDMLQFKELGFNIMRTAHYPQDNAILDACDELGILVYEEAPTWISITTNQQWYANLEKAARIMIRNHYNHPAVIIWGAGINHRGPVAQIHNACKQEDPFRFTASQGSRWTGPQHSGITDIYAQMIYGDYYWNHKEPMLAMEGRRGPEAVNHYLDDPLKLGLIAWTAHAYYTFHPTKTPQDRARGGMMTVFRWPKKGTMWYRAELTDEPFTYIEGAWTNGVSTLEVYSNAEEVELLLNGKPYRKSGPSTDEKYNLLNAPPFIFEIDDFKPGTLTANGLENGNVVSSMSIRTPEKPAAVKLILDTGGRNVVADGADILVAYAQVVDQNGTPVTDTPFNVTFSVNGPASIVGEGKGIGANPTHVRHGHAPVLIRAGTEPGTVTVTAEAAGLKSGKAVFKTVKAETDMIAENAGPIYDFESVKIDIGGHSQLVQFGWTPWMGDDNTDSKQDFEALGGFSAVLRCTNPEMLRWLGEMNVMGRNGFAWGDGVLCMDENGLLLELSNLRKGRYRITTGHHAPRNNSDSMDPNPDKKKNAAIHQLPYARKLKIETAGESIETVVTEGKAMHEAPFGSVSFEVESNGRDPVVIRFSDASGKGRGIWLNTLEISEWK